MSSYLLDTGVVIRHLRGERPFVRLLRGLGRASRLAVSVVTRLEVHAGMHPDERYVTQKLLSRFQTLDLDRESADHAGSIIYQARSEGVSMSVADAIIAATARRHNLTLITLNPSDFQYISGLRLYPMPE